MLSSPRGPLQITDNIVLDFCQSIQSNRFSLAESIIYSLY